MNKQQPVAASGDAPLSPSAAALLNATAKLLSERSAIDVSLSDIAQESGMNSALVKYYFGSKDGLLLALLLRDAAKAREELQYLVDMQIPADTKLRYHIRGTINAYFRSPYLNRLMHYLIGSGDTEASAEITRSFVQPVLDTERAIIEEGVQQGLFRDVDPELLYFSLIGACDHLFYASYSLRHLRGEGRVTDSLRQRYIEHVSGIYLHGMLRQPENPAPQNP